MSLESLETDVAPALLPAGADTLVGALVFLPPETSRWDRPPLEAAIATSNIPTKRS